MSLGTDVMENLENKVKVVFFMGCGDSKNRLMCCWAHVP